MFKCITHILIPTLLIYSVAFAGFGNVPGYSKGPIRIGPTPLPWSSATDDSAIFSEDFENGLGDWTTIDVTAPGFMWHIDDYNAYQGNSWWCADTLLMGYDNHWLQYLVSPTLNFTGLTNITLTFKLYYAVEAPGGEPPPYDGWDGCNVWASYDNGAYSASSSSGSKGVNSSRGYIKNDR